MVIEIVEITAKNYKIGIVENITTCTVIARLDRAINQQKKPRGFEIANAISGIKVTT